MKLVVPNVYRHASIFRFMGNSDVIDQEVDQYSWLCNCCAEIIKTSDPLIKLKQDHYHICTRHCIFLL